MIVILIYILGLIPAYLMLKKSWLIKPIETNEDWTFAARGFCLCMSIFSWASFFTGVIIWLIGKAVDSELGNRKANW